MSEDRVGRGVVTSFRHVGLCVLVRTPFERSDPVVVLPADEYEGLKARTERCQKECMGAPVDGTRWWVSQEYADSLKAEMAGMISRDAVMETITARAFHEAYERLAPEFGYKTREASAVTWDDVPKANKALMEATVRALLASLGMEDGDA